MAKRDIPEINAGSMADIAFLLLIFFLVTTTMDSETGLVRKLPPMPEDDIQEPEQKVKKRNIFEVLVNANDQLLVEGEFIEITELREKAKKFIKSDPNDPNMPEFKETDVPFFGRVKVSKQIISLQNDNGTSYEMYLKVQNELVGAYNELREELCQKKWGIGYKELKEMARTSESAKEKIKAIKKIYPQRISEAEPKNVGK